MNNHPTTVNVCGLTIETINDEGIELVPIEPLLKQLGITWYLQPLHIPFLICDNVVGIGVTRADGEKEIVSCFQLRDLYQLLYTLDCGDVSPAVQKHLLAFQKESDAMFAQIQQTGVAINPRFKKGNINVN